MFDFEEGYLPLVEDKVPATYARSSGEEELQGRLKRYHEARIADIRSGVPIDEDHFVSLDELKAQTDESRAGTA